MSLDSRIRDELRAAVDAHDPREEDALRYVKATHRDWADLTVVTLEERESPRSRHARTQRMVGALAACALLAGAVALPAALRSRPRAAARPASSTCGPQVSTGYRSTAVVRVAPAPSASTRPTDTPKLELTAPVQFALGLCDVVRDRTDLRSTRGVGLEARTNASGDLLSLVVVTRARVTTHELARNWANEFTTARHAEAKRRAREQLHRLDLRVQALHRKLRAVDTKLAKLLPETYGDVLEFDAPNGMPGHRTAEPPPVPEQGGVRGLNLAFERIQLIAALSKAGEQFAPLQISDKPDVYATFVSLSPPVLIRVPRDDTNSSTVLLAVGLLTGGVLLAGSAFWLGRRRGSAQAP